MSVGLRPSSLSCEGRNCFWLFSRSFPARCTLFLLTSAVFSRLDAVLPCRCAGFSVRRGCASLALMLAFATSCGALGCVAQRFRGLAPRCSDSVHRFAPLRRGAVEKARRFSTYPQFVFHSLFHGVEKMSTFPCVSPRLSVFPPPGAPIPSRRGEEKSPSRARIYNIGAEKGEKGSALFAAFRCGRGLLGARGAEWWSRPVGKGLTVGRGAQKGVGECVGSGLPGAPVGVGRVKVVGRARSVCTRVATAGGQQGRHGRCACTIRAQF